MPAAAGGGVPLTKLPEALSELNPYTGDLRIKDVGLVLAVVRVGHRRELLVLTSRGQIGWNQKECFELVPDKNTRSGRSKVKR